MVPTISAGKPLFVDETVYHDTEDYSVRVGSVENGKPPVYLVIRKKSGVVEFAHEVEAIVLEWISHFEEKNHPERRQPQLEAFEYSEPPKIHN